MPAPNKPLSIMAADVLTQVSVLWKNIRDFPQRSELDV
jgi:hypothetical protein